MSLTIKKDRKAVLTEKLSTAALGINVFGLKFVRISYTPGDTFFHYICDDSEGRRHYLSVEIKERTG